MIANGLGWQTKLGERSSINKLKRWWRVSGAAIPSRRIAGMDGREQSLPAPEGERVQPSLAALFPGGKPQGPSCPRCRRGFCDQRSGPRAGAARQPCPGAYDRSRGSRYLCLCGGLDHDSGPGGQARSRADLLRFVADYQERKDWHLVRGMVRYADQLIAWKIAMALAVWQRIKILPSLFGW